ncbi:MAG: transposase [Patescibacteria group bacterium]
MRSIEFGVGEIYHVYSRGVDKRIIFCDPLDYQRFLESLWIFNTATVDDESSFFERKLRGVIPDPSVTVSTFALMPNHFHLLIQEKTECGTSKFMHRLGTSYTQYFNRKHERSGRLFESPFKAKHVNTQAYLEQITRYIHLNPLDVLGYKWKTEKLDINQTREALINYPWSSFRFYFNQESTNFLDLSLLNDLFPTPEDHLDYLGSYEPNDDADEENLAGAEA